ncbi:MAG: DUF1553 domain-containing protein [Acidobacteria bacterium]|nr:DUF1553 domain-containing protein [Acidobacteriota bacterium]
MRLGCFLLFVGVLFGAPARRAKLVVYPENPLLFGKGSTQRLVVQFVSADGRSIDVTESAKFSSEEPEIARVDEAGLVRGEANGGARIHARYRGLEASTTALVQRAGAPLPRSFAGDILPILTKHGCNGGACHGALHKHGGRRINLSEPEKSLLLAKPTFAVAHGGGKILKEDSAEYRALLDWIRAGAKSEPARERRMLALRLTPASTVLIGEGSKQRLLVTARYSDGSEADVTGLVRFQSNDDTIAPVLPGGVVEARRPGETAIAVRGPGVVGVARAGVVIEERPVAKIPEYNFIDRFINAKLQSLRIPPSPMADAATFLRRAYLDIIGVIPTAEEARTFLASKEPDKRAKAVDGLLKRPEYADYWATYWGDHLSNTRQLLYNKGPYAFTEWLNKQFRSNVRYDEFVRRLMTSTGNMYDSPATSFYPVMRKELDMAAMTSQLFLGVNIECARCHNHPLERWTQDDFNGMAAFFSQVRYKNGAGPRNNERNLYIDFTRQFQNPDTKKVYLPKPLDGRQMPSGEWQDRREMLVEWLTSPENPYFARAMVNRMWRNFMGRGLVEPVDDFRVTNPATNDPLLEALARDFAGHGYDIHHLIRRITSSAAYQLSSEALSGNKHDKMAYSRFYPRRMIAEQMVDSIALATGVPEEFPQLYPGTRAAQIPEPEIESYVMEVFDRPSRQLICERKSSPTLNQALHLAAGETIQKKIAHPGGILGRLLAAGVAAEDVVEELYVRSLARFPTAEERANAAQAIARSKDARTGMEDVFWALLNSKEFLYNH